MVQRNKNNENSVCEYKSCCCKGKIEERKKKKNLFWCTLTTIIIQIYNMMIRIKVVCCALKWLTNVARNTDISFKTNYIKVESDCLMMKMSLIFGSATAA